MRSFSITFLAAGCLLPIGERLQDAATEVDAPLYEDARDARVADDADSFVSCGEFSDDAFYSASPSGSPGQLLACEIMPESTPTVRILYTTEGSSDTLATSSALVRFPQGDAPKDGFPIVAWAHGTTGLADACAPSKYPQLDLNTYVLPFVEAGYALVATDYQGLGTPGPHPYLVGESEGVSVLDSTLALLQLKDARLPSVGRTVFLAGHSQGGHAALFAREIAASGRLSEFADIAGTIAYAPGLSTPRGLSLVASNALLPLWGGESFFTLYLYAATLYRDGPAPDAWLQGRLAENVPFWAETMCYLDFESMLVDSVTTVGDLFTESFIDAMSSCAYTDLVCAAADPYWSYFVADEPGRAVGLGPALIVQGMLDELVPTVATSCLVERMTVQDAPPELCTLVLSDHLSVVEDAFEPVLTWMQARIDGTDEEVSCDGIALPSCESSQP